jgi:membrane carboxypeptidase/penicillin-binding protein
MRTALAKSKNMVSIRILQAIGTHYAQDYASRFGFDAAKHPPYLTMALGAGSVTPGRWSPAIPYLPTAATRSIHTSFVKFATKRTRSRQV